MVQLFHHFETPSCIFLLLEYVSGGKVMNFINSRRGEIQMSEAAKRFQGVKPLGQSRAENYGSNEPERVDTTGDHVEGPELTVCTVVDDHSSDNQREGTGGLDVTAAENPDMEELSTSRQALGSSGVSEVVSEQQVALWMAQLVRCLSSLHESSIVCRQDG